MAQLGRISVCFSISVCLLIAGASAFPFTYPNAFSYYSSRDASVDRGVPVPASAFTPTPSPSAPRQAGGQRRGGGGGGGAGQGGHDGMGSKVWCIAKPASDEQTLMGNIAYACEEGGIDCTAIQPGGSCFSPRSLISHASFVMNMYYQKNQRNWWTCHFNSTGILVFTDPSFGDCVYSPQ